jgi:hypothetical protein
VGLYEADLYSLTTLQLTGVMAAYALHRLHVASKLPGNAAALATAVHITKTVLSGLGYAIGERRGIPYTTVLEASRGVGDGGAVTGGESVVVEIGAGDFVTLFIFLATLLWFFVYTDVTKQDVSFVQASRMYISI